MVPLVHEGAGHRAGRGGLLPAGRLRRGRPRDAAACSPRWRAPARRGLPDAERSERLPGWRAAQELTGAGLVGARPARPARTSGPTRCSGWLGLEPRASRRRRRRLPRRDAPRRPRRAASRCARGLSTGHREVTGCVQPRRRVAAPAGLDRRRARRRARCEVTGASIDITDAGGVRACAAASRASLAAALELSRDRAPGRCDVDDRPAHLVPADVHELMGLDPPAQPADGGRRHSAALHPDDRAGSLPWASAPSRPGGRQETVYRVAAPDGAVRHVRAWTDVRRAPGRLRSPTCGAPRRTSPSRRRSPRRSPRASSTSGSPSTTRRSACR